MISGVSTEIKYRISRAFLDLSELLIAFSFLMECSSFELECMCVYVLLIHMCTYGFKYKHEPKSPTYCFQKGERTKND